MYKSIRCKIRCKINYKNLARCINTKENDFIEYNKMFFFPMCFMLCATLTSLVLTIFKKFGAIGAGEAEWGDYFQLVFAVSMAVLAVILVIEGVQTFKKQSAKK